MKKNILFIIMLIVGGILLVMYFREYNNSIGIIKNNSCNINQSEVDSYANKIIIESVNYTVENQELEREATDGSNRKVFTDKDSNVVLIEDRHSGESGYRTVSVVLRERKVVKVFDFLTTYKIPPIEDPNSKPELFKNEFYINKGKICKWYKDNQIMDSQNIINEKEYLDVINGIINDAESVAGESK